MGKEKEAIKSYKIIIKKYPDTSIAGDAYFSLGDYYFANNRYMNAKIYFKKASEFKESKRYGWTLYKLGWCHFNLGDHKKSLDLWKNTVIFATIDDASAKSLKDEALRDMVFAFAELRQIEPAIKFYRKYGGQKYIPRMLFVLGQTYVEQGKIADAVTAFERLLELGANSPEAFKAEWEIMSINFLERPTISLKSFFIII